MQNDELNRVERLRRRLYSRKHPYEFKDQRSQLDASETKTAEAWKADENAPLAPSVNDAAPKKSSFLTKLFVLSVAFFLLSLLVALGLYFKGFNRISPNNVDITIAGPISAAAGEEVTFEIIVSNDNPIDIDNVILTVEFPEGARSPDDITMPLRIEKLELGLIATGQSARRSVRAVLFGEKDAVQDLKVIADYNIKSTNAEYKKEKAYQIGIKSSPVILTLDYPIEVNAGQAVEMTLEVTSNTNSRLENVAVRAEYPFGFAYSGSDPAPYYENYVWHLGDLEPLEKKTITIRGSIQAQHDEERTFRFFAGNVSPDDDRQIGVNLTSTIASITIKRPYLALDLSLSGSDTDEVVLPAGGRTQVNLNWKNNLPVNVVNGALQAKIEGEIFDEDKIGAGNGYYRSLDNTMFWDKTMIGALGEIPPGNSGQVGFSITTKSATRELVSQIENPEITVTADVTGGRLSEGGVPETLESSASVTIKVASEIGLSGRVVRSVGPFENTGPIPPKVDAESTYTVIWSATNSFNNVSGARVTTTLPPYAKWLGATSPAGEKIGFNPLTQEIVWEIGELKRGVGFLSSPREVAFQIAITPSITHLGFAPAVINDSEMTARDNFTGTDVSASLRSLTTILSTDPNYSANSGTVVR